MEKKHIFLFIVGYLIIYDVLNFLIREIYTNQIISTPFQILASLIIVFISYFLYIKYGRSSKEEELLESTPDKKFIKPHIIINYILLIILLAITLLSSNNSLLNTATEFYPHATKHGPFFSFLVQLLLILLSILGLKASKKTWEFLICWGFTNLFLIAPFIEELNYDLNMRVLILEVICVNILLIIIKRWKSYNPEKSYKFKR